MTTTTDTITLGILTLVAEQDGPFVRVDVTSPTSIGGTLHLTLPEWSSLRSLVDVLAAADRRHKADREEIERLRSAVEQHRELLATYKQSLADLTRTTSTITKQRDAMRAEVARMKPLRSVLGNWHWRGIVEDSCWRDERWRDDYKHAVQQAAQALAEVEGAIEKAKERSK